MNTKAQALIEALFALGISISFFIAALSVGIKTIHFVMTEQVKLENEIQIK